MFPIMDGQVDTASLWIGGAGNLKVNFSKADEIGNYFPAHQLKSVSMELPEADKARWIEIPLHMTGLQDGWYFLELSGEGLLLGISEFKLPGVTYLVPNTHKGNTSSDWSRPGTIHYNSERAPCLHILPAIQPYKAEYALDGHLRPFKVPHLWVSAETDFNQPEWFELSWQQPYSIDEIHLAFDTDLDSQLTNIWMENPDRAIPSCVKDYKIEVFDGSNWTIAADCKNNYQRRRVHKLKSLKIFKLRIVVSSTWGAPYASIYDVRVYS